MLHLSAVLPSQPRRLFFVGGIFAVVAVGALVAGFCSVWNRQRFVEGYNWQAACAWCRKARELGPCGIKQERGASVSEEAVAQWKPSLPGRPCSHVPSSSDISPMYWKSLPSTGAPEDQPQLSGVSLRSYPRRSSQTVLRLAVFYKANPLERGVSGSARMTVSARDLNLKWHLLLTSATHFRCLPASHLVQHYKGESEASPRAITGPICFLTVSQHKKKQHNKCHLLFWWWWFSFHY